MPKKIINVKNISRDEWLEIRRNSIGGSDSASACGQSPWKSELELWLEKTGQSTDLPVDNEAMEWGRIMEPVISGEKAGLECKTMNDFSSGDYDIENGEIPVQYYYQVQHYMMVMNWEYMYIAFSSNFKFTWLKIDRNDDFIRDMRQKELDFWYNHVVKKIRPESDGSDSAMEALIRLYPNETPDSVIHFDFEALGKRYIELNDLANRVKAEKDEIRGKICDTMQDAELGLSDNYKASWKTQSKNSFDTKRFKADYPDLYEKYSTVNSSRVFRLNQIKRKEEEK